MPSNTRAAAVAALSLGLATSCTGSITGSDEDGTGADPSGNDPSNTPGSPDDRATRNGVGLPGRELAATIGVRRLSIPEYNNTLRDLVGDKTAPASGRLPPDARKPFDSYLAQESQVAGPLIGAAAGIAADVSAALMKDVARRDRVIGCTPASNPNCLKDFVKRFGRRALRRPLADPDVQIFLQIPASAGTAGDFYASVQDIVTAFLQDMELLHRVEIGTPVSGVPGLYKLGRWEMASRLSYFLWGSMPPDWLFDHIENENGLSTSADVRTVVDKLLADPRARDQVAAFHALWLGYADLADSSYALADDMLAESNALIAKVIFEERKPWQDLFRSTGTIASFDLATHYRLKIPTGLTKGSKPMWVSYEGTPRRGLVSQTSILRFGSKFGDTSPTVRGKEIRERLFCDPVPKPDPALLAMFKADTSAPPASNGSPCKWDRYKALENTSPACAGCHVPLDAIGFGLESFDSLGRYRTYDADPAKAGAVLSQCPITHDGALYGTTYKGAAALQDSMLASPQLKTCLLGSLYKFSTARADLDQQVDKKFVEALAGRAGDTDFDFGERLMDIVTSDAFAHRRMEK